MPNHTGTGFSRRVGSMSNAAWIDRQTKTPEARREYEQERLIAWVFERIAEAMEMSGKSKAVLARALNTSRANITQLLSGQRNATLRTLADLAWACDSRLVVSIEPLRDGNFVDVPMKLVHNPRGRVQVSMSECRPEALDQGFARVGMVLVA